MSRARPGRGAPGIEPIGPLVDGNLASNLHCAVRRNAGAFKFGQDAAIAWDTVTDYGDIAFTVGPDATVRQLTPHVVTGYPEQNTQALFERYDGTQPGQKLGDIADGTTKGENRDDGGTGTDQAARLKKVLVPGTTDRYCWLHRIRCAVDVGSSSGTVFRSELGSNSWDSTEQFSSNTVLANRIPYEREVWWASAIMFGDSADFPGGQAETWTDAEFVSSPDDGSTLGAGDFLCGWQIHPDMNGLSPAHGLYVSGSAAGTEGTIGLTLQTRRPTTLGQAAWSHSLSSGTTTGDRIWQLTPIPMRQWLIFINCVTFSVDPAKASTRLWYAPASSEFSATPAKFNSAAGATDLVGNAISNYRNDVCMRPAQAVCDALGIHGRPGGVSGEQAWGYLVGSTRTDPQAVSAGSYLRHGLYAYDQVNPPSATIRTVPLTWHYRPPWRSIADYAGDLHLLLQRMVGL